MNTVLAQRELPSAQLIQRVRGDLTAESSGDGVAGAVTWRGGPAIQRESTDLSRKHALGPRRAAER